jgi:hypothetical protein
MTIDAYSFYGARSMPLLKVTRVPSLVLKPRIFTNTENVEAIEVSDTSIDTLEKFVFEGLKDVHSIVFSNVDIEIVESFAFSGIHFRKSEESTVSTSSNSADSAGAADNHRTARQKLAPDSASSSISNKKSLRTARYAHSGGELEYRQCRLGTVQSDTFRDANIAHILFHQSTIDLLVPRAFRGASGLQSLTISNCQLGPRLAADTFTSLRALRRLHLIANDFRVIEPFAFRDVTDVDSLRIRFQSGDNVTLMTEAFAHMTDVSYFELLGGAHTTSGFGTRDGVDSATSGSVGFAVLNVDVGAFRNLVDVQNMRIANFRLPVLRRHSFGGLSRVGTLTIVNCGVTNIEREAFTDALSRNVAGGRLDMSVGNQLECDYCGGSGQGTAVPAAALLRELDQTFTDYLVTCRSSQHQLATSETRLSYRDVREVAESQQYHVCSGATLQSGLTLTMVALLGFVLGANYR